MRSLEQLQKNVQLRAPAAQRIARVIKPPLFSKGHRLRSYGNLARNSGSSPVEAAQALPALQQQPPLLLSVRALNPAQPNPRHQTLILFQSPSLSLQLPALPNPNRSLHQPLLRTPPRTPQQHLALPQLPPPHLLQTVTHQPPLSQPGRLEVRRPDQRQQRGRRVWQTK